MSILQKEVFLTSFGMRSSCDAVWELDSMPAGRGTSTKLTNRRIIRCSLFAFLFPFLFFHCLVLLNLTEAPLNLCGQE